MTVIRASCDRCGDIELTVDRLKIVYRGDDAPVYRYVCPFCRRLLRQPASRRVVAILLNVGCEVVEPRPITEAEVAAFVDTLDEHLTDLLGGE